MLSPITRHSVRLVCRNSVLVLAHLRRVDVPVDLRPEPARADHRLTGVAACALAEPGALDADGRTAPAALSRPHRTPHQSVGGATPILAVSTGRGKSPSGIRPELASRCACSARPSSVVITPGNGIPVRLRPHQPLRHLQAQELSVSPS